MYREGWLLMVRVTIGQEGVAHLYFASPRVPILKFSIRMGGNSNTLYKHLRKGHMSVCLIAKCSKRFTDSENVWFVGGLTTFRALV